MSYMPSLLGLLKDNNIYTCFLESFVLVIHFTKPSETKLSHSSFNKNKQRCGDRRLLLPLPLPHYASLLLCEIFMPFNYSIFSERHLRESADLYYLHGNVCSRWCCLQICINIFLVQMTGFRVTVRLVGVWSYTSELHENRWARDIWF